MKKVITRYHESGNLIVCSFEITDLETKDIDNEVKIVKENFKEKDREKLVVVSNNIKCEIWISDNNHKKKEIDNAKNNLIIKLKKLGYDWGEEKIVGDGHIIKD